jgi:hypothetical protein
MQVRVLLMRIAWIIDVAHATLVEVERTRRWIDPRRSRRVVTVLIIAGVTLAVVPYAGTLACVVIVFRLFEAVCANSGTRDGPQATRGDARRGSTAMTHGIGRTRESSPLPEGMRRRADTSAGGERGGGGGGEGGGAGGGGGGNTGGLSSRALASATGSEDPWVLVSGGGTEGAWRSHSDDTQARAKYSIDPDAADCARPQQPPQTGVPLPARLRDMLQEAVSKRRAVPRCKGCTQQIDTLWKRRAVCTGCEEVFCTACCPLRKGKPRLCKSCTDPDAAQGGSSR